MNNRFYLYLILYTATSLFVAGCDEIFGSKDDKTTDEIFVTGRVDPSVVADVVGYASLTPFWTGFDEPTDVHVGFDELVYVTDSFGVHVLDRAGRNYFSYPLKGAVSIVQDRNLHVYVAARIDTVIEAISPTVVWDLPAVYKIKNLNGAGPIEVVDIIVHPFADATRSTVASQRSNLLLDGEGNKRDNPDSDENVEFTGVAILADNTLYVTRRGPKNNRASILAPDNTMLEFFRDGANSEKMVNVRQFSNILNPNTPSLASGIGISAVGTFVGAPQRERLNTDRSFIIAQADQTQQIQFRVLYINAVETPDGLQFLPNTALLAQDTARADDFLYRPDRFLNPSDIAYAPDGTNYIFITDAAKDSVYIFQQNGYEGVNPPPGSIETKPIVVSFGGRGNGPRELNTPSGVAYFREVLYIADKGNNRITRYKLNTDFE